MGGTQSGSGTGRLREREEASLSPNRDTWTEAQCALGQRWLQGMLRPQQHRPEDQGVRWRSWHPAFCGLKPAPARQPAPQTAVQVIF